MKTTKEVREVIKAIGAVVVRTIDVRVDGKISLREKLSFVGDVPEVWDAIKDIGEVPAELADLDANEYAILVGDIRMILIEAGLNHRNSDIAQWVMDYAYNLVRGTVELFHKIKSAPPTAIPV